MPSIRALRNAHPGETAYVIGKGPSLLRLREDMLGPGPIIALNHAILHVRGWRTPLYTMQKDGCVPLGKRHPGEPCDDPLGRLTVPEWPEILLVSQHESPDCFAEYRPRYIFDNEADFGVPWFNPSSPIAARIAALMGATKIVFVSHDGYTIGDRRMLVGDHLEQDPEEGYAINGLMAAQVCEAAGIEAVWLTP